MAPQLSAVAAAKARQAQYRERSCDSDSDEAAAQASENEDGQFVQKDRRLSQSDLDRNLADNRMTLQESDDEDADDEAPIQPKLAVPELELSVLHPIHSKSQSQVTTTLARKEVRVYPADRIAYLGVYDFRVLAGVVSICGARLPGNPSRWYRVYAFASHPLPVMTLEPGEVNYATVEFAGPTDAFPDDGALRKEVTMRTLEGISSNFVNLWLPRSMARVGRGRPPVTFGFIHRSKDDPLGRRPTSFDISRAWTDEIIGRGLLDLKIPHPVALVCGGLAGPNAQFAQVLTNHILSYSRVDEGMVMFLDLDPVHPEYGPPGQVSLVMVRSMSFGPPFTRARPGTGDLNTVVASHAVPKYVAQDDPDQLIACAKHLYKMYTALRDGPESTWGQKKPTTLPLVIKTPTCLRAHGEPALASILMHFGPILTHWFTVGQLPYFHEKPALKVPEIVVEGPPYSNALLTSEQLFEMQGQSYFHIDQTLSGKPKWNCEPLVLAAPYTVPYAGAQQGFLAVHPSGDLPAPHRLPDLLRGALVAITVLQDLEKYPAARVRRAEPHGIPYLAPDTRGRTGPVDPRTASTVGFGYVQAVRTGERALEIVTPIAREVMARLPRERTVVQVGLLPAPGWAYLEAPKLAGTAGEGAREGAGTGGAAAPWVRMKERRDGRGLDSWLGESAKRARAA